MSIKKYLNAAPLYKITKYNKNGDINRDCIQFTGSPKKHPYDKGKMLLVSKPFSSETSFYEFKKADILHVEDMPGIATDQGQNLFMAKIWVKKGSLALKFEPFEVDNPIKYFKDSEALHKSLNK